MRVDGSTDATFSIVLGFAGLYSGRVRAIEDGEKKLGSCKNFAVLMELALKELKAEI